jgi:hypothetical protein
MLKTSGVTLLANRATKIFLALETGDLTDETWLFLEQQTLTSFFSSLQLTNQQKNKKLLAALYQLKSLCSKTTRLEQSEVKLTGQYTVAGSTTEIYTYAASNNVKGFTMARNACDLTAFHHTLSNPFHNRFGAIDKPSGIIARSP